MKTFNYFIIGLAFSSVALGETRITGSVTDELGAAISGAMVHIHWDSVGSATGLKTNIGIKKNLVITTDAMGQVSVELPAGFYDVFVSAMAFSPACRKIRVKGTATFEFQFRLPLDAKVTEELGLPISSKP